MCQALGKEDDKSSLFPNSINIAGETDKWRKWYIVISASEDAQVLRDHTGGPEGQINHMERTSSETKAED